MRLLERAKLPLCDFPRFDRIILDSLHFDSSDIVAEIGVGTGTTAFEVSHRVKKLVGIDISSELIEVLQKSCPFDNLSFVEGDTCDEELAKRYCGVFTKLYSCETLEHVKDLNAFFHNISEMLQPRGLTAILFPVWKRHGRTHFRSKKEIEEVLPDNLLEPIEILAVEFKILPRAFRLIAVEVPLRLVRVMRNAFYSEKQNSGQNQFHQTDCFKLIKKGKKQWHTLVNIYWVIVMFLEELLFSRTCTKKEVESTIGERILILARKNLNILTTSTFGKELK